MINRYRVHDNKLIIDSWQLLQLEQKFINCFGDHLKFNFRNVRLF